MFSLASTKLSSASCVRLLLTVSFLLWSLGTARAAESSVGSLNPKVSGQDTMLYSSQIALHVPQVSPHRKSLRTMINNEISMNVGRFFLDSKRVLTENAGQEATQLAESSGAGSKEIGWVWTADLKETRKKVIDAHKAVKGKHFDSNVQFFKAFLDSLLAHIPHDDDIPNNWQLAMKALEEMAAQYITENY
ncbi:hypothetical protein C8R42DRAFT_330804 [Lentinula raphanica]|nr:hypothetical protein C8R42DRAFT_330804 [Lentinula raphanica]